MRETTTTKRYIKNHAGEGHFCSECGEPATQSCTDARQDAELNVWTESEPRYGCSEHRVETVIYFADGTSMTARQYEVK